MLDRLVGYKASPMLWKTVKKGVSAGRVQTVALRLIVEREREIRAFKPVEYWTIEALLEKERTAIHGQAASHRRQEGGDIERRPTRREFWMISPARKTFPVTEVKRRERRKNPYAPFTTSTLQQEAAKKLGFGSKRTMRLAQDLYEGIEIGAEGAVGLITYMRTDSTRVAESAATAARDYLRTLFGEEFLAPGGPQLYGDGKGKNTQDAHEAVRPTDPTRRPDTVKRYLKDDQFKLYELIWKRFMASQMAPAVFDTTTVEFRPWPLSVPRDGERRSSSRVFRRSIRRRARTATERRSKTSRRCRRCLRVRISRSSTSILRSTSLSRHRVSPKRAW